MAASTTVEYTPISGVSLGDPFCAPILDCVDGVDRHAGTLDKRSVTFPKGSVLVGSPFTETVSTCCAVTGKVNRFTVTKQRVYLGRGTKGVPYCLPSDRYACCRCVPTGCLAPYCPTVPKAYRLWMPPMGTKSVFGLNGDCALWTDDLTNPSPAETQFTSGRMVPLGDNSAPGTACPGWTQIETRGGHISTTILGCGDGLLFPNDQMVLGIEWSQSGVPPTMQRFYTLAASSWNCTGRNTLALSASYQIGSCLMGFGFPFGPPAGTSLWPPTLVVFQGA